LSCQPTGPARALTDPLLQRPPLADLLDGLATLTRFRLLRIASGPDAMGSGVVFTGTDTPPILSKSIGRYGPQNRVGKSMRVCCRDGRALALPARKETCASWLAGREVVQQGMRGMVPILSVMKVGRDRPQLCARESRHKSGHCRKHMSCPVLERLQRSC